MNKLNISSHQEVSDNARELFMRAYENRYYWPKEFKGYKGNCSFHYLDTISHGRFIVKQDFSVDILNIKDQNISSLIKQQLFEIVIHRVYRPFEKVHAMNTFSLGNKTPFGKEILVGGKSMGDKYCIKDNIITMVSRNIQGKLIKIFTQSTIDTNNGYIPKAYESQYFDPISSEPLSRKLSIQDDFILIHDSPTWVLSSRVIKEKINSDVSEKKFLFNSFVIC